MSEPVRVALLARPGTACEHLQAALAQAGAEIVLVADPLGSDAAAVTAAAPRAVLVALDPAVEDVLDRYDPVLLDPAMTVIYDEAELAAKREGWDAARWTRHLAAKLGGHDDVLPPGRGEATAEAAPEAATGVVTDPAPGNDGGLRIMPAGELSLEEMEYRAPDEAPVPAFDAASEPEPEPGPEPELEPGPEPEPKPEPEPEPELEPGPEPEPEPEPADASVPEPEQAAEKPSIFANLSLETRPDEPARPRWSFEAEGGHGAVVLLAGIGGPDAVRQFLGALPSGFGRPVVIRQRLDGGKHDRLVRQLQRATSLPVQLAEAGKALESGHVYILPDGLSAETGEDDGPARFAPATGDVPPLMGLPGADSGLIVLSGADPAFVPGILVAREQGALVAGQSPDDCFDPAAASAVIAGGGHRGTPAELASRVSTRWLSLE